MKCCCQWGASVGSRGLGGPEYPEFGCAKCLVHQAGMGETELCKRHAGDDQDNNLVAAGAIWALLQEVGQLTSLEVVTDAEGNATNQIDIGLSFMASAYRITVERVTP